MDHFVTATILAAASLVADVVQGGVSRTGSVSAVADLTSDVLLGSSQYGTGSITAAAALDADAVRLVFGKGRVDSIASLSADGGYDYLVKGAIEGDASLQATPSVDGQGLLVRDMAFSVLSMLLGSCGCETCVDPCLATSFMNQVNAALQMIYGQSARLGYFNRDTITLSFDADAESKALPQSVQQLHGPVRLNDPKINLRKIDDRAVFHQFVDTYYPADAIPTTPRAYYLHASTTNGGDNLDLTLYVAPTPSDTCDVLVDVLMQAPRYDWSDVTLGTPLSLPNQYAEGLLLPLVREWATTHEYYRDAALVPQIKEMANAARELLGLINPKPEATSKEKATA